MTCPIDGEPMVSVDATDDYVLYTHADKTQHYGETGSPIEKALASFHDALDSAQRTHHEWSLWHSRDVDVVDASAEAVVTALLLAGWIPPR